MAASSKWPFPLVMTPSLGTRIPPLTKQRSPTRKDEASTSTGPDAEISRALSGAKDSNFSKLEVVFALAKASMYFPIETRAKIIPAPSKYKFMAQVMMVASLP